MNGDPGPNPLPRLMVTFVIGLAAALAGCTNQGVLVRTSQERDRLAAELEKSQRDIADRDARIRRLDDQITALTRMGPNRPADLFAPVKIEILSRSGGRDYDGLPGDDGVRVYLRPLDAAGHTVKVPGEITIRLQDNGDLAAARDLGVSVFNAPDALRGMWYGRFGTNHYTADCHFRPGARPGPSGRVLVIAEFRDFLTGRALSATKEVEVASSPSPRAGAASSAGP
jgi:hypothetical protein